MEKSLILVKFASPQDFCGFYAQMKTGRVALPASRPLSARSKVLLKIMIPEMGDNLLLEGIVASSGMDLPAGSGMIVDVAPEDETKASEIRRVLAQSDAYAHLVDSGEELTAKPIALDENDILFDGDAPEINGLEMEISENEIEILENSRPAERQPVKAAQKPAVPSRDWDVDLMNLRMENEPDGAPKKIDLSMATAFMLMEDEDVAPPEKAADPSPRREPEGSMRKSETERESIRNLGLDEDADAEVDKNTHPESPSKSFRFEDLKEMVAQDEFAIAPEPEPEIPIRRIPEKKDLTPEERQKAEPVGQFFMNLTKAMLRSGYYAPGHPGGDTAKTGLYSEFLKVLAGEREIMVINHTSREGVDLMISGILDEPVSIRLLVGAGVAELFAPKLAEYCDRKKLLSFALRRDITPDHFDQFIDIMSDPKVDTQKDEAAGKYLTRAFVERGITEVSTVFVDDMVKLETDLPWRVEMAIHRLAKDLKVMPMFKEVSSEAVKEIKIQTVQDIIRPLKYPTFLNDFLVNCYLISKYVKTMAPEEIEEIVVEAFSMDLLLPTSRFTFMELENLKRLKQEKPDNAIIDRRINGIKRILKLIARRVVAGKAPGARTFLEQLYQNDILRFDELPPDVQYMVHTIQIAEDVRENYVHYIKAMAAQGDAESAAVYLKSFRRAAPVLMDGGDWKDLARIAHSLKKISSRPPFHSDRFYAGLKTVRAGIVDDFAGSNLFKSLEIPDRLPVYVFKDYQEDLIRAYGRADESQRKFMDHLLDDLGPMGVDLFAKMLAESKDREVRKFCYEKMIEKGAHARNWAISILKDQGLPWFTHRNALMVLAKVSDTPADFEHARIFAIHSNPKIREEVLNAAVALKPRDGESLVLGAIQDPDPKVRWRAMRSIPHFSPVSSAAMERLLEWMAVPLTKDKESDEAQLGLIASIASAIFAMPEIPMAAKVEAELLAVLESVTGSGKASLWDKVKRAVGSDQAVPVLKAAIPLLGRIGTPKSAGFLKKTAKSHPDLVESIKKAMDQIKFRK